MAYDRGVPDVRAAPLGLRARKKADTRIAILSAATRLFAKDGYVETSVARIAEEAGVSLPTLFRYFPTKADLLFDGADDVVDEWRAAMFAGPADETLGAALRRATHVLLASTPRRTSAAQLRAELTPHDAELRRKALEIDARVIGRIAGVVAEWLAIDPAEDPRAFLVASCAMAAVRSAQHVVGRTSRKRPRLPAAVDDAFDALDALDESLSQARARAGSSPPPHPPSRVTPARR